MKRIQLSQFAALAGVLLLASAAPAGDTAGNWPTWRGPKRDGISTETGLLKEWPAGGPKQEWKITGLGEGYSSVTVAGGRIYTMGDGPDSCNLIALDMSGKPVWTAKVGAPKGGGGYPGPRCSPTVDGELVIALGQYGDLVCVATATGKEAWRKSLSKEFGGKMMSGWGYAESPLIDGPLVVCTPGGMKGAVLALNKKTGELVWQSKEYTDTAAYASLVPVEIGGIKQYMQFTGASVAGVAADSGKLLWRAPRAGKTAVVPTPIYHDNMVFVTSGYGVGCNGFKITAAGGAIKAEQVYATTDMVNHHGGAILVGEHVYGHSDGGGGWTCMELKTGKVAWKNASVGKGSVAYADGHLYARSEGGKGVVALVEATPQAYKEKGRFDQPDRSGKNSWPHPVIAGGKLYLRDQDVLLCYDVKGK